MPELLFAGRCIGGAGAGAALESPGLPLLQVLGLQELRQLLLRVGQGRAALGLWVWRVSSAWSPPCAHVCICVCGLCDIARMLIKASAAMYICSQLKDGWWLVCLLHVNVQTTSDPPACALDERECVSHDTCMHAHEEACT
eukprot:1159470-Pelagomonas_calceolata.AAC.1